VNFFNIRFFETGSVTDLIHAKYTFGLPEQAIALIMRDVLNALEYLHGKNFVHRCEIFKQSQKF